MKYDCQLKGGESMNFYEINNPYYALIKAKDEVDATRKYIEVVAGSEEEFEEIREEMDFVGKYYSAGRLALTIDTETGEYITISELLETINSDTTEVLVMDGSLI